jgi:hypothetical protein
MAHVCESREPKISDGSFSTVVSNAQNGFKKNHNLARIPDQVTQVGKYEVFLRKIDGEDQLLDSFPLFVTAN